jgi:hypothetical protein
MRFPDGFGIGRDFRKHQGRAVGILVAHGIRPEISITFLAAETRRSASIQTQRAGLVFGERAVVAFFIGWNEPLRIY